MTLSDRQIEILDLIVSSIVERGYPPSIRELRAATGLTSGATLTWHLRTLEDHGYIERDPHARAIRVLRGSDGVRRELRMVRVDENGQEIDEGEI